MASIKDDNGYNQGFKPSKSLSIRTKRRSNYIISKMDNTQDIKVLEIGCGTGEISYLIAKKIKGEVLGTDICKNFIEEARKKYQNSNLRYDFLDFNDKENIKQLIGENKFDYIIGNGILHHLHSELDTVLLNFRSLLNDNGKIIFLEPNILNPYCFLIFKFPLFRKMANLEPGEMAFSREFITKKLKKAGYEGITVKYKDFLIPGTPEKLIKSVIIVGKTAEKIPLINKLSQSIYVTANKN